MLPTINGKNIIDCDYDDLQTIIDNSDYRENEYIDYKGAFVIDKVTKDKKEAEKNEFRNDVCAFANANGGYLIYGIEETQSIPSKIIGITILNNNTDNFEKSIMNYLQPIKPRIPYYRIKFIKVPEDKFVVILFVQHDLFAPYMHLVDEKCYYAYRRVGNSKHYIEYQELRTMFNQSLILEKEIDRFRQERIDFFLSRRDDSESTNSIFFLMHLIPETFMDSNYDKPMFIMAMDKRTNDNLFYSFECNSRPIPMVDGIRYMGREVKNECRLYNNGIAEYFVPLHKYLYFSLNGKRDEKEFEYDWLWEKIHNSICMYASNIGSMMGIRRMFACISIMGCEGVITDRIRSSDEKSYIDRDRLLCSPAVFELIDKGKVNGRNLSQFKFEYYASLGIMYNEIMKALIEEIKE